MRCLDPWWSWYAPTERRINLIAPRSFLFAFGLAYSDPSTCQTIASTGSQAWRKQSGGQCGSFQNLVLKSHAFGIVFLKPFFRGVGIREHLDVLGVANLLAGVDVRQTRSSVSLQLRLPQ
jgi:hypothetical protein